MFDPPGSRHSLPQLTWDGTRYTLIGYDGPPTSLIQTTFDFGTAQPASVKLGAGGLAQTATNGKEIAIVYTGTGANVPREASVTDPDFIVIDGRRVHAPRKDRNQSFFMVTSPSGGVVIKPIALGDQRVSHTAPGVGVAWNPRDREWGVVWSEFNHVKFARISQTGKLGVTTSVAMDRFIDASSRMVWNGSAFAFVAHGKDLVLFEIDAAGVRSTVVMTTDQHNNVLEPVLAYDGTRYAIAYRVTTEGTVPKPRHANAGKGAPAPGRPQTQVEYAQNDELRFVTVAGGKATKPVTIAKNDGGPVINTPVIQADGAQFVIVWGERQVDTPSFDDRLKIARVDAAGTIAKGYPTRIDSDNVHQGSASIAGTGCDLAISYARGNPNGEVTVAVVRAP